MGQVQAGSAQRKGDGRGSGACKQNHGAERQDAARPRAPPATPVAKSSERRAPWGSGASAGAGGGRSATLMLPKRGLRSGWVWAPPAAPLARHVGADWQAMQ